MALDFLDLARKDNVPHRAVLADGWYGNIPEFRQELESRNENYILGAYSNTQVFLQEPVFEIAQVKEHKRGRPRSRPKIVFTNPEPIKLSALGESIADDAWQRLELRLNSKDKPLVAEAVSMRVWPAIGWKQGNHHEQVWLLIERRPLKGEGYELRYFFSNMPQHLATIDLARLYHERYWIEHGYQQLKEELGLDHHEGRSWNGWHRHVLLTSLAYGYLTLLRLQQKRTEKCHGTAQLDSEKVDTGKRRFFLKSKQMKQWRHGCCSLRSSERWRQKQRLKGMPSLPDVRHQITKLLVKY